LCNFATWSRFSLWSRKDSSQLPRGGCFCHLQPVTAHLHALERQHLVEERNGMAPDSASDKPVTAQDLIISVAAGRGIGTSLLSLQRYYTWPGVRFIPIIDAPWEPTVLLTRRDDFRPEIQGFRALANILAQELRPKPASFSGLPVECGHSITAAD
jgi:hypothetical protein